MSDETTIQPRHVQQVIVSSNFTESKEHRETLINAIHGHKLHANVMEHGSAHLVDVIEPSLQTVRDSAGCIGVNSLKYGQTPECPNRNPARLSNTELGFDEAQRLGKPIPLFIIGDMHQVAKNGSEIRSDNEAKLDIFHERARKAASVSLVHRVNAAFKNLDDFKCKLNSAMRNWTGSTA